MSDNGSNMGDNPELLREVVEDSDETSWFVFECPCGEFVDLRFNGGELDREKCACGLWHTLEHGEIFHVVSKVSPWGD